MENKSHTTEIHQKTRIELENGDVSFEEIDAAIRVSWIVALEICHYDTMYNIVFLFHVLPLIQTKSTL